MQFKSSNALKDDYTAISQLAKDTGEPIFITDRGTSDGVFMSVDTYEEREQMFRHREKVYAAELSRLNGDKQYTPSEVHERLEALFRACKV